MSDPPPLCPKYTPRGDDQRADREQHVERDPGQARAEPEEEQRHRIAEERADRRRLGVLLVPVGQGERHERQGRAAHEEGAAASAPIAAGPRVCPTRRCSCRCDLPRPQPRCGGRCAPHPIGTSRGALNP